MLRAARSPLGTSAASLGHLAQTPRHQSSLTFATRNLCGPRSWKPCCSAAVPSTNAGARTRARRVGEVRRSAAVRPRRAYGLGVGGSPLACRWGAVRTSGHLRPARARKDNAPGSAGSGDEPLEERSDGETTGGAELDFALLTKRIAEVKQKNEVNLDTLRENWRTGKCSQKVVVTINDWVRRLCFLGDTLAVGTFCGAVLVYDIPSGVQLAKFDGDGVQTPNPERMEMCAIAMSLDGNLIGSGSVDGVVKVHSLSENCCVYEMRLPSAPIKGLRFDPLGDYLVAVSETKAVQMRIGAWEDQVVLQMCDEDSIATVACMAVAKAPKGDVWYMYGLANGMVVAQCALRGVLKADGTDTTLTFRPHSASVTACDARFEGDQLVLYTGCHNGEVAAWKVTNGRACFRWSLLGHQGPVAALQSDEQKLVRCDASLSCALDGTVRVWEVNEVSGHPLYAISGHTAYIGSICFEAGRLICDGTNNAVLMHDFLNPDDGDTKGNHDA